MESIPAGNVEFQVETREGRDRDGGPSIRVQTTEGGEEIQLLRFDCFRTRPHYHYAPGASNASYDIDPTIVSDSLGWVISQLRTNLRAMVQRAGYPAVAERLDQSAVTAGLARVEAHFLASKAAATPSP